MDAAVDPRTFTLDDGSVYQRIPAADLPDGDAWDSTQVEAERAGQARIRSLVAVVSQNGWTANDRSVIASFTIPGTKTKIALRAGDVSVLILDFLGWWNREIEPIDGATLDDWGYAERLIRGSATVVSNHASGTAGDANALRHPLGTRTLTKDQLAKIKARIDLYRGALRHGAFYTDRPDEMHVEINAGPQLVREVADDIRAGRLGDGPPTSEEDDMSQYSEQLDRIERRLLGADVDKRGYDMLQSIEALAGDAQNRIRGAHPAMDSLQVIQWQIAQIAAAQATQRPDVDEKALADQILAGLAPQVVAAVGQQAGLTAQQIADITERVVRGVFADAAA